MTQSLSRMKIALLVSNGFNEAHFMAVQKMVREAGALVTIVSAEKGMVMGLNDGSWGHNHAVDVSLNTALGVDYDALVIPGGEASHTKLKKTAHTSRFIGSFMAAQKPMVAMGNAQNMMQEIGMMGDFVMHMEHMDDASAADMIEYLSNSALDMDEAA